MSTKRIINLSEIMNVEENDYLCVDGETSGCRKILPSNLPISNTTQMQLNLKASDSSTVHKTGTETITGAKTFSSINNVYYGDGSNLYGIAPTLNTSNMPGMANNATTPNTQIDFSAGFCWDMSTLSKITNISMTKKLDASFVTGSGNGGLDTGTKAISTWYHCFAISKADGTSDFLFSTSVSTPTMPTGFVNKRRIGSIKTNSGGNIMPFIQYPNGIFRWNTQVMDLGINSAAMPTTATNLTLSTPFGVITKPYLNLLIFNMTTVNANFLINGNPVAYRFKDSTNFTGSCDWLRLSEEFTNASSQITYNSDKALTIDYFQIYTLGWKDFRGEQ